MNGITTHGLPHTVNENDLIRFVTHCAHNLRLKHTTIKSYLAGIRNLYIKRGKGDILLDLNGVQLVRLQLVLRGIKKDQNHTPQRRLPITAPILRQLCALLHVGIFGSYCDLIMESALLLGWFGCMRSGEFTAKDNVFDASAHLAMQDVDRHYDRCLNKKYIQVRIKASKTDPFRKGSFIKLYETGYDLCPFRVLSKLLAVRSDMAALPADPLLYLPEGTLLTRQVFVRNLRTLLSVLGYADTTKFCGHSLRRGLASSASAANVPDHVIAAMGRWESDCYKLYIDLPNRAIASAQHSVANPDLLL